MTELHLDSRALQAYGSLPATVDDAAEVHVLRCSVCREGLAVTVHGRDLERSWDALADRLGLEAPAGRADAPQPELIESTSRAARFDLGSIDAPLEDLGSGQMHRRRRRHTLVAAGVVLVAAVIVVSTTGNSGDRVAASGRPGWVDILPPGSAALDGAPPADQVIAMTGWNEKLVVITSSDDEKAAWMLDDGDWTRHRYEPPAGCDPHGGLAAIDDRLALSCSAIDAGGVFVATTSDLANWETHVVADAGGSFGTGIGPSPGGGLTVTLLEAVGEGNTTRGSTLRVWTSTDLEAWTEIPGGDDDQLLDAAPQRIRSFGDTLIVTGARTVYPDDTAGAVTWRPAVWLSSAGGPFTRIDVAGEVAAANADGWIVDVFATSTGYVAVGGTATGSRPLAWTSTDLATWIPASFFDDVASSGMLWSVAHDPGGTLLAVASKQAGEGSLTWTSADDGATWQIVGEGPDLLARRGQDVVGARSGDRLRVQRWDRAGDSAPASETEEDALVLDVGSLADLEDAPDQVMVVPADGTRYQIFVVRDGAGITALSARSPKQGCRLVFATEFPDLQLGRDAFFHDPCHGANFDRTGNRTSGPSFRDMYRYDVEERNGRILVDTGLLRPGSWIAGMDQEDPPLIEPGETDAVAERWRDIVEDADGRRGTDPTVPVVVALGAFHEPGSGLVTVPFTFSGAIAHLSVGPATVHPPDADPDDPAVETHQVAEGTVVVESGPDPAMDEIRLTMDLADGLRLRIDLRWGFEADPVPELVAFIDHITRTAT